LQSHAGQSREICARKIRCGNEKGRAEARPIELNRGLGYVSVAMAAPGYVSLGLAQPWLQIN
jgi:hypothetical protein